MFAIVAVVIVVIPVAVRAPTVAVFIPPAVVARVASFARFVQVMARFVRLAAFASMMLDGFVKTMVCSRDSALAIVVIGAQRGRTGEEQKARQCRTRKG